MSYLHIAYYLPFHWVLLISDNEMFCSFLMKWALHQKILQNLLWVCGLIRASSLALKSKSFHDENTPNKPNGFLFYSISN
jgi:hypothetical protein